MEFGFSLTGLLVGFLVGLTGVGGGSLMAPLLILLFGFHPAVAVGTDLWFAAITKTAGGIVHGRFGSPDWQVMRRLALGSVPAAVVTLLWLGFYQGGRLDTDLLLSLLGAALLASAAVLPLKDRLKQPMIRLRSRMQRSFQGPQLILTVVSGAAVGCLVALTSVGAGALVAALLILLYPLRLDTKSVIGTDIIHAIPLAFVAAVGHSWLGNVDWALLGQLLIGSIPGILVGSMVVGRINEGLVRGTLAVMLAITGLKLIIG